MLTSAEKRGIRIGSYFASKALSTLDAALFYAIFDGVFGVTITWPLLFVVAWTADTYFGPLIRERVTKDVLAKKLDIFGLRTTIQGRTRDA